MHERNQKDGSMRLDADMQCAKGVSRRVVVVPAKDHPLYDQVIYVVKDEAASRGVTAQEVLREAQRCLPAAYESSVLGEPLEEQDAYEDADHISKALFALSGIALALSSGLLIYWFFAM